MGRSKPLGRFVEPSELVELRDRRNVVTVRLSQRQPMRTGSRPIGGLNIGLVSQWSEVV